MRSLSRRARVGTRTIASIASLTLALLPGCGGEDGGDTERAPAGATPAAASDRSERAPEAEPGPPVERLVPPPCPPELSNCERASGRILYVERVDPDGDGDAHFVLVSSEGVTAPGISVIDVALELRPDPLPGPGKELAASGPVYEGSYGQRQIEAIAITVEPRPGG